jgi:hypothetical protein
MLSFMLFLTIGVLISGAYAESVTVYVPPLNDCLHRGYWKSIGWVGSTNIYINGNHYNAYCVQYDIHLYAGYTYTAEVIPASDSPGNRSISYILTWYHSSTISNDDGFAIQCAVWKYATGNDPTGSCGIEGSRASQIYNDALGKNVVRPGDVLTLTPNNTAVPVGTSQTVTARIVNASGSPKPGIRILFSTTFGILDKTEGVSDANGEIKVSITSSVEGLAEITASTKGLWAHILDLWRNGCNYQNIIGIGYPELVAKSEFVFVRFFVVPEVPLGTVTVTLTSLAAMVFLSKMEKRRWSETK